MARAVGTGLYVSCPGNSQPGPMGGLAPAHGMMVFVEKKRCVNGDVMFECGFCSSRMFGRGSFWKSYGLTREQVRALFPGAIDAETGRAM